MSAPDAIVLREDAVRLRRAGRLEEAIACCRSALEIHGHDAGLWNELAHALRFAGEFGEALTAAESALRLDPELAVAWFNLGAVLEALGQTVRAEEACRRAVALQPTFAEAWSNLGGLLAAQGRLPDAIEAYRRALDANPRLAPIWSNLGNALCDAERFDEAVAAYDHAVALDDADPQAWNNLGTAHLRRTDFTAAVTALGRALTLAPRADVVWKNLRHAFAGLVPAEVVLQCERLLAALPGHPELAECRAEALQGLQRWSEALAGFEGVLGGYPANAGALYGRAYCLQMLQRAADALAAYDCYLEVVPADADALNNRAIVLQSLGRNEEAIDGFCRAIDARAGYAEAHFNLANVLSAVGRPAEALTQCKAALAARPGYVQAQIRLSDLLQDLGRSAEAVVAYEEALRLEPPQAGLLFNYGIALQALGRHEHALAAYDRALALNSAAAEIFNNRGNVLHALERHAEALASYEDALRVRPDYADARYNRAVALEGVRRFEEALAEYERAVALRPDYAAAYLNRGNVLQALGRAAEAVGSYDEVLRLQPQNATAHANRGNALVAIGRVVDALASYDAALAIDSGHAEAMSARAGALYMLERHAEAAATMDRLIALHPDHAYAPGNALFFRLHSCNWQGDAEAREDVARRVRAGRRAVPPFSFVAVSGSSRDQLACAQAYVRDISTRFALQASPLPHYAHERIRIAYVSADFREHPVAFLTAQLYELHDRSRFEVCGVSLNPDPRSEMQARLLRGFDRFIDASHMTDGDVVALLRQLEIDIAVDLMGHTGQARAGLWARRAAPVQVNYLGYPGTSGAQWMDYIVGDRWVIPESARAAYSEGVVWMPDTYMVHDRLRAIADRAPSREECGLPASGFVFCCFNNNYKIAPPVFDIWMRLLRQVEGSVLWLRGSDATAQSNVRREAIARGVDGERLIFAPRQPRMADHLARQRCADLFVDTLPFNAHTTACDALWAGLPVLTCAGTTFAGRVAASLLDAVGLPELITTDAQSYERLALELATAPHRLDHLRRKLAHNRLTAPLFDSARFCRHLEAAYQTMHDICRRGEAPRNFAVAPLT